MRRIGLIALFLVVAATAAAVARTAALRPNVTPGAKACGGVLWRMKTFSDGQRGAVRMTPQRATIGGLRELRAPYPLPRSRRTKFQRQVYEVVAQITEYRLDGNELRLVLFDNGGGYMNAVIPSPACLSARTRYRDEITRVWNTFSNACGRPTRSWQPQGAVVFIEGVGFWSSRFKNRRQAAPNGAELHPVTGLRSVAGCGR